MSRRYWYRPEVGPQPPLILISTNIGLDCIVDYARFKDPGGQLWECGIETALRLVDLIQEPDRTKLLASAEQHYRLPLGSMMGPESIPAEERCGT